jgi:hypothetical protein
VVEGARRGGFSFFITNGLSLVRPQRIPESFVKRQGDDRLWKLIEISSKYVCSVVDCVASPVKTFAILGGRVENGL